MCLYGSRPSCFIACPYGWWADVGHPRVQSGLREGDTAKSRIQRQHASLRNGGDGTAPEPFTTARGHCDLRPSPDQSTGGNRLTMSAHGDYSKGTGMRLRSLFFVPGEQPQRFEKAADSGTAAVTHDLEDRVRPDNTAKTRTAIAACVKESKKLGRE